MNQIQGGGAFTRKNIADINTNFSVLAGGFTPGNILYANPASSNTGSQIGTPDQPFQSFTTAYGNVRNSTNDVLTLVGNGDSSGTARIDASFTWGKSAANLVGVASPSLYSQRARFAPSAATTAFTPFWTVSGSGCTFQNISWFMGFTTGTTSQIGMVISGSRNVFQNCQFAGMADNESAQSAGSRSLKITGGENLFEDCVIGVDTITRTQANASLEFASGAARNVFRRCIFPFMTNAAGVLGILGTGAACIDRHTIFEDCMFINAIKSTSTAMTVLASFTSASPGGLLVFTGDTTLIGIGEYGDTNGLANSYIRQNGADAATQGIGTNPS